MPSSASTSLRLELQATGENLSTWGERLNDVIELIEQGLCGVITKSLTGNVTLTSTNYASDEARNMVIKFTDGGLSGVPTVTVPAVDKIYIIHNAGSTYNISISCGGTAATVRPGMRTIVYCDATDCFAIDPTLDQIKTAAASLAMGSQKITGLAAGTADTDAVNKLQVTQITSGHRDAAGGFAAMAATQAQQAESRATAAATSATSAASSATAAATSETNAATSETNAASSASTASTQATNAASSATTASTQATNAASSATTASTQATNAASSASSASTSATTATTQASNASTSATNAATSATNAATSATNAATSETNAAASAVAAAASAATIDTTNIIFSAQVFG